MESSWKEIGDRLEARSKSSWENLPTTTTVIDGRCEALEGRIQERYAGNGLVSGALIRASLTVALRKLSASEKSWRAN